jgi:hypothetical protein
MMGSCPSAFALRFTWTGAPDAVGLAGPAL